jgi:putative tricarboxylic transport membrane protein
MMDCCGHCARAKIDRIDALRHSSGLKTTYTSNQRNIDMNARKLKSALVFALYAVLAFPHGAQAQEAAGSRMPGWKPTRNVEIVVPTSAGTGGDATARFVQRLLTEKKLLDVPVIVVNKPGGAANIGLIYLAQQAGNAHYFMQNTAALLTNHITGKSTLNHTDITPLAQIGTDAIAFAVRADSSIRTARDLADRLKGNAASVNIAFANALGNQNHIAAALVAKGVGANVRNLKVIVFNGSGEAVTAVLGGHVDVVVASASALLPHSTAGTLRLIAVSSPQRSSGALSAVPTWKEAGINAVSSNWRSLVGPKGMSEDQIRFWDDVFARMVQLPEWKQDLDAKVIDNTYLNARDTRKLMETEYAELAAILGDLGLRSTASVPVR